MSGEGSDTKWGINEYNLWKSFCCPVFKDVVSLDLKNCELSELDFNIYKLVNLIDINLDNNKLHSLPDTIVRLEKLKKLDISNNPLESFTFDLFTTDEFEFLDLSKSQIWILNDSVNILDAKLKIV
jgi:Leucine-rich repeat (LRR) protein